MTAQIGILIGVATVGLAAAVGAFTIAWQRATHRARAVNLETLEADAGRDIASAVAVTPPELTTGEESSVRSHDEEPAAVSVAERHHLVEVSPEEAGITRRQFFNRALGTTFFAFIGVLSLDFLAFLWPKLTGGFGTDVNAGKVADLLQKAVNDDGTVTPVYVPEAKAYVVPAPDPLPAIYQGKNVVAGGLFALYQRCTHLGCRVPWCQTSQGFECPCHGSKYSVIGEYFTGPAPRSLDRFVVEITDAGDLVIKTGQIVETPRLDNLNLPYPQGPSCID